MRRQDREVTDINKITEILSSCKVCHLAMIDENLPYVLPLNFAFEIENGVLTVYFHCAKRGKKIDILKNNNTVCFEMCNEGEPIFAEKTPCNSGYYYSSVQGNGKAYFVESADEKCTILSLIMKHQANIDVNFNEKQADTVAVFKVVCNSFTAKQKPKS